MTGKTILLNKEDRIATITINRQDVMNAVNHDLLEDLLAVLDEVNRDDDIWAVILTSARKAFCAGIDLKAKTEDEDALMLDTTTDEGVRYIHHFPQAITRSIIELEKPRGFASRPRTTRRLLPSSVPKRNHHLKASNAELSVKVMV